MRWLLNSAVIAAGAYGTYTYSPATVEDLCDLIEDEHVSRIGYDETASVIEAWTGYRPAISRETSALEVGDDAIVVRLRYRVDPREKGRRPAARDDASWEIAHLERVA
jgi:hypothetical protein